jgi:hypothetical protein
MSDKTALRVEPDPLPSSERGDYSSILEENLALLRRADEMQGKMVESTQEAKRYLDHSLTLQKELDEEKAKRKLSSYRAIRRKIIWINMLVALFIMFGPTLLWYKAQSIFHPGICAVGLIGIVWMIVTCTWLDGLADRENY